ncbi:hypothetical protein BJ508DRAFT_378722 [Ascobolus immersus RN42]|uniref:Uncharacterized protein n=1 Tax=Ascobolus immersus RN42 TaxID=1160509 RepID=A0A3N4I0E1_ASCIM|nr:hypothetical protein BJ508DRAFT_378722 [Ascobolus immersus RN42]
MGKALSSSSESSSAFTSSPLESRPPFPVRHRNHVQGSQATGRRLNLFRMASSYPLISFANRKRPPSAYFPFDEALSDKRVPVGFFRRANMSGLGVVTQAEAMFEERRKVESGLMDVLALRYSLKENPKNPALSERNEEDKREVKKGYPPEQIQQKHVTVSSPSLPTPPLLHTNLQTKNNSHLGSECVSNDVVEDETEHEWPHCNHNGVGDTTPPDPKQGELGTIDKDGVPSGSEPSDVTRFWHRQGGGGTSQRELFDEIVGRHSGVANLLDKVGCWGLKAGLWVWLVGWSSREHSDWNRVLVTKGVVKGEVAWRKVGDFFWGVGQYIGGPRVHTRPSRFTFRFGICLTLGRGVACFLFGTNAGVSGRLSMLDSRSSLVDAAASDCGVILGRRRQRRRKATLGGCHHKLWSSQLEYDILFFRSRSYFPFTGTSPENTTKLQNTDPPSSRPIVATEEEKQWTHRHKLTIRHSPPKQIQNSWPHGLIVNIMIGSFAQQTSTVKHNCRGGRQYRLNVKRGGCVMGMRTELEDCTIWRLGELPDGRITGHDRFWLARHGELYWEYKARCPRPFLGSVTNPISFAASNLETKTGAFEASKDDCTRSFRLRRDSDFDQSATNRGWRKDLNIRNRHLLRLSIIRDNIRTGVASCEGFEKRGSQSTSWISTSGWMDLGLGAKDKATVVFSQGFGWVEDESPPSHDFSYHPFATLIT